MNTESKLRLQAYLDNEVSSAEARQIASWIERDAEAKALCDELRATKSLLVAENELPVIVPDSREFYWSKIQREIERTEREPVREVGARPWWSRFLAPVVGAAALALFVFTSVSTNPVRNMANQTEQSHTDNSITFYSPENKTTVVWIASATDTADNASSSDLDWEDFE